jgi:4'-phosphopantetheinyl transferase
MPPELSAPIAITWPAGPADPAPSAGAVRVWAASLNPDSRTLKAYECVLSASERERVAAFKFEWHRRRFIAGRGLLRTVLAGCLKMGPEEVEFAIGPKGKPVLGGRAATAGPQFNLAHSQDLALLAVTRVGPVGVDVECIRPVKDSGGLVKRFFSAGESEVFQGLDEALKPAAFMNLWTRKEALLKSTGEGITNRLGEVEVTFLPGEPARLVAVSGDESAAREWTLHELQPARGFTGAVAVRAREIRLECWRWG